MERNTERSAIEILFQDLFYLNEEFNILVCKEEEIGVLYSNFSSHINTKHKILPAQTRKKLCRYILPLYNGIYRFPTEIILKIPYLKVFSDGFRCNRYIDEIDTICGYISRSEKNIKTHIYQTHRIIGNKPKNQYEKTETLQYSKDILCQRFFNTGSDQRYFEVQSDRIKDYPDRTTEIGRQELQNAIEKEQIRVKSIIVPDSYQLEPNPWLQRTGWARHLAGFSFDQLKAWISLPNQENRRIQDETQEEKFNLYHQIFLEIIIENLVLTSAKYAKPEIIGLNGLFYINRKETGEKSNEQPMNISLETNTLRNYSKYWSKILLYLLNTWNLIPPERPNYVPTNQQRENLEYLSKYSKKLLLAILSRLVKIYSSI